MKRAGKTCSEDFEALAWKQEQIRSQGRKFQQERRRYPSSTRKCIFLMQATAKSPGSETFSDHLAHPSMLIYLYADTKTCVGWNPEF